MRFPRFLRRFLIGYLLLHAMAAVFFVVVLSRVTRTQMISSAKSQMKAMALMLQAHIDELPDKLNDDSIVSHIRRLGNETQFRFTVISKEGVVLADSETGTRDIGLHGSRPEIIDAQTNGLGFAQRYSDTLRMPMMYLALPTAKKKPGPAFEGFIRVAAPAVSINQSIGSIQTYILLFALIVSALTALLMLVFSVRAMLPLQLFSDSALKIGVGQYDEIPTLHDRDDEWKMLGQAFTQMRSELASREFKLTANSRRLEAVLSSMIEGVLAVDSNGIVIAANGAACKMLSLTQSELLHRKLVEIVRYPELLEAIESSQHDRSFSKTEFQTMDGDRKKINARVSVLSNDAVPGVAIVLHDVTELRTLENMRRDFAANVSHELKTPLASIKAYAETLRLGAIDDQEKNLQFVEQIEKQAEALDNLIHDLLELARVESENPAFDITRVSLDSVCTECVQEFELEAEQHDVNLAINCESNDVFVHADGQGMRTIVSNLISNAIHYTPSGGSVLVHLREDSGVAVIEVVDTGIGITPEHHDRVFERFYRVDKARSRDQGGTGLGLAIVKHIAQSFGGSVHLNSRIGKGSTFSVQLPLAR